MREPVDRQPTSEEMRRRREEGTERPLTTADMARNQPAEEVRETHEGKVVAMRRQETSEPSTDRDSEPAPLFRPDEAEGFRSRWTTVQAAFVDDPRRAVEDADHLIAEAMQRLAQVFSEERTKLDQQWDRGDDVSTEDLRIALHHYRSFFQRLLAA